MVNFKNSLFTYKQRVMRTGSLIYTIICGLIGITSAVAYFVLFSVHLGFFAFVFLVLSHLMYKDYKTGRI